MSAKCLSTRPILGRFPGQPLRLPPGLTPAVARDPATLLKFRALAQTLLKPSGVKRGTKQFKHLYQPFVALAGFLVILGYSGHAQMPLPTGSDVQNAVYVRCVPDCSYRGDDGKCRVMSSNNYCDYMAACVPNCKYRGNDGKCRIYGADYCGSNARCIPSCELTQPDGSCAIFAADQCSIALPGIGY